MPEDRYVRLYSNDEGCENGLDDAVSPLYSPPRRTYDPLGWDSANTLVAPGTEHRQGFSRVRRLHLRRTGSTSMHEHASDVGSAGEFEVTPDGTSQRSYTTGASIWRLVPPQDDPGTPTNSRRIPKRLASYLVIVSVLSYISLLGVIALVSFLWHGDESNPTWGRIVRSSWITRTVTLLGLAIRLSISFQASLATSMLASLAMEHIGVYLPQAPEISFATYSNSGPHSILLAYWRQPKSRVLLCLLVILVLSTSGLQFSSTLLLSDLAPTPVTDVSSNLTTPYGFQWDRWEANFTFANLIAQKYDDVLMNSRPWFGEYRRSQRTYGEIDDTGIVIRTLLPIAEQVDRESLHSYEGPATAFDARVACTQPVFTTLDLCDDSTGGPQRLCGRVAPRQSITQSVTNTTGVFFSCSVPRMADYCGILSQDMVKSAACAEEMAWTACYLQNGDAGGLISSVDATANDSLQYDHAPRFWRDLESDLDSPLPNTTQMSTTFGSTWAARSANKRWPVELGKAWLVFNATADMMQAMVQQGNSSIVTQQHSGPWTDTEVYINGSNIHNYAGPNRIRSSICYDALPAPGSHFHFEDFNISLKRSRPRKEPSSRLVDQVGRYDTSQIRLQYGALKDNYTAEERGVFEIAGQELLQIVSNHRNQWTPWNTSEYDVQPRLMPRPIIPAYPGVNASTVKEWFGDNKSPTHPWLVDTASQTATDVVFCVYCVSAGLNADFWNAALFKDVLADTDSPALALQSYLMSRHQGIYYSHLPFFNKDGQVATTSFITRLAPVSYTGFFTVMGLLLTHICACTITVLLFLAKTEYSCLGNGWRAFAQVANSPDVQELLAKDIPQMDDNVRDELKRSGASKTRYRLTHIGTGNDTILVELGESAGGLRRRLPRASKSSTDTYSIPSYIGGGDSANDIPLQSIASGSCTAVDSFAGNGD